MIDTDPNRLVITRPDDMHLHLRDGEMLKAVAPISARHFARAIIMPNLVPPVVTLGDAVAYRERILRALEGSESPQSFEPMMTLYLTETTDPEDVAKAAASAIVKAVKLYPAGATTNSQSGVQNIDAVSPVLDRMAELGLPLCIHGEVTHDEVDIFDREAVFLETVLDPLRARHPELRIILEHVTTEEGVDYINGAAKNLAGTITTHHLMINRNQMLAGGIRPHYYCLPILKRRSHQEALRKAATSANKRFFLGTDSAPHTASTKETACGCAGCFTAPNTLSCLAHVFEEEGALPNLESFTSLNGADCYGLARNSETITLEKASEPVGYQSHLSVAGSERVAVFDPSVPLYWRVI